MTKVLPFKGLRYSGKDLSRVTAPPYDIISEEQQKELYSMDPDNVIRLEFGYQSPRTPTPTTVTQGRLRSLTVC